MAITLISSPDNFSPLYTISAPWIISSNLQAQENFKYIFDLYRSTGVFLNRIATYPRPDGSGLYSPHYTLQSFCDTICYATSSQIESNSNSKIGYYFKYAEQYNPGLTFGDTYLIGSYVGNKLGLEFRTNISSQILIGDLLTIQKDNIAINPWISGTASVIGVTNSTLPGYSKTVFLDKNLPGNIQFSSDESGAITNLYRASPTQSITKYGWNAARQYDDFSNFGLTYVMSLSLPNSKFLSVYETAYTISLTQKKPIYSNEYETLDLMVATNSFSTNPQLYVSYLYKNAAGSQLAIESIQASFSLTDVLRFTIPTGTANILALGGSGSQFLNNGQLKSYVVAVGVGDGVSPDPISYISSFFNYEIVENCRPYEVIRLAFLNKLGGYDYWSFNLVSRYTREIQRKEINRALSPVYSIGDRGRDVIYGSGVENWKINTDFLTDDDAIFIRELTESTSVYLVDGVNLIPVIITDKNWVYKSGLLDGYVQYTISFEKSNDIIFNR
jgi:hypothetical protein